jgi:hypothetical protein
MKKIIRLTESDLTNIVKRVINESLMGNFIEVVMPELNKLNRKSNHSSGAYGFNEIYYNKETKDYIFRYEYARRKRIFSWTKDGSPGIIERDDPNTLWIKKDVYDEIKSYIPSGDEMILKWFNERYKKDAKALKTNNNLKER